MRSVIILAILAGTGYYLHNKKTRFESFQALESGVLTVEADLDQKKKERDRLMQELDPLRRTKAEVEGKGTSVETVQEELTALQDELKTSNELMEAAEVEFICEMEAVRALAKKKNIPALKLKNGDELLDCTIMKFAEGYVVISHTDGVKKINDDDLPDGWVGRYSLDYIDREADADKDALGAEIDEVTLTDDQISKLQISEVDEKIRIVETELLALRHQVRDKSRKAEKLVRDAYKVALQKDARGDAVIARRTAMFQQAKKEEGEGEVIRARYRKIREQKMALEKKRNEIKYQRTP